MRARTIAPLRVKRDEAFRPSIPGSKSYTNRALVLAAQRTGTTRVENASTSDDARLLSEALDAFDGLAVEADGTTYTVERRHGRLGAPTRELFLDGAATPARFLLAFATTAAGSTLITGNGRLRERPMSDVLETLASLGVRLEHAGVRGHLPIRVHGIDIEARDWRVRAGVSSQFTSALCLLAAQQRRGPIRIELAGDQVSTPYVDMTLSLMSDCGIRARRDGDDAIEVLPGTPDVDVIPVEPDASGMSYFLAAAAVTRTSVEITGLGARSAQGDVGFARVLERMGCELEMSDATIRLTGRTLRGIEADLRAMPDAVLTLAAVAAVAEGPTRIVGGANLRAKESDRIHAAARELERLGVTVEEGADSLVIRPSGALRPARIETWDDHRVAMAFAVLGLVAEGVEIVDPDCVTKSFPGFWNELARFREHHEGER